MNAFMGLGHKVWKETRDTITRLLSENESTLRDNAALREEAFVAQSEVRKRKKEKIYVKM